MNLCVMFLQRVLLTIRFFCKMNEKIEYGRFSAFRRILLRKSVGGDKEETMTEGFR